MPQPFRHQDRHLLRETFTCTFLYFSFCLPSSEGERFVFPTCECYSQIQGESFPPPTLLNLKPTRAPRPRCCLNFTLRLDFHPFRAGLVYTGCGVREITVCVSASAGLGFLEPPQANLKLTAWKIRLPFSPLVSLVADRGQRQQDRRRIRCIIIPRP